MAHKTIYALSSGSLPSGVAIIRISGPECHDIAFRITGRILKPRVGQLTSIKDPDTDEHLDQALVLKFDGPASFTGEDVVELHCHGGVATVAAVLEVLSRQTNCLLAEAGEFSRRAFENGRMDLTALEGLSDLIAAQTEFQRRLALKQSGGQLRKLYDGWREDIIQARAYIEAEFDFSDEEDVPGDISDKVWGNIASLRSLIKQHLDDDRKGEIIRSGFRIALLGPPNVGKSSLLNALAKREVAIVTPLAGTTRDVIEVSLNFEGMLVVVSDTAGLRESNDIVEAEGMRRAQLAADDADLVLWLEAPEDKQIEAMPKGAVRIQTKSDIRKPTESNLEISVNTVRSDGLDELLAFLKIKISMYSISSDTDVVVTRQRHRDSLNSTLLSLNEALDLHHTPEIRSECLRLAGHELGRITGRIDVEDLLDVIFSEFCVGK